MNRRGFFGKCMAIAAGLLFGRTAKASSDGWIANRLEEYRHTIMHTHPNYPGVGLFINTNKAKPSAHRMGIYKRLFVLYYERIRDAGRRNLEERGYWFMSDGVKMSQYMSLAKADLAKCNLVQWNMLPVVPEGQQEIVLVKRRKSCA